MSATAVYICDDDQIPYTPDADVAAGDVVVLGDMIAIAKVDIAAGTKGALATEGTFSVPKDDSTAMSAGDVVYWKAADSIVTPTPADGKRFGVVSLDAADTDERVRVILDSGAIPGQAATVAALTDNSGGATADGTIGVVTLPDLSGWNGSTDPTATQATAIGTALTALKDAVKELATKQNAVLSALKDANLMS